MTTNNEQVIEKYNTKILLPKHPQVLALLEQDLEPLMHGDKIWSSTYVMMDYLMEHPPTRGERLMDIGCGWGLLSAFAAKQLGMQVTAVDADDDVLPFAKLHADINNANIEFIRKRFENITTADLKGIHTLVGTDICFWDELQPVLYNLIRRALKAGVEQIIFADPGRGPFHDLSDRCEANLNGRIEIHHCTDPLEESAELLIVEKDLQPY